MKLEPLTIRFPSILGDILDFIICFFHFREDYETGLMFTDEEDKDNFYSELKSAAESGWDFSTRWFIVNGTNKGNFIFILQNIINNSLLLGL